MSIALVFGMTNWIVFYTNELDQRKTRKFDGYSDTVAFCYRMYNRGAVNIILSSFLTGTVMDWRTK